MQWNDLHDKSDSFKCLSMISGCKNTGRLFSSPQCQNLVKLNSRQLQLLQLPALLLLFPHSLACNLLWQIYNILYSCCPFCSITNLSTKCRDTTKNFTKIIMFTCTQIISLKTWNKIVFDHIIRNTHLTCSYIHWMENGLKVFNFTFYYFICS